MTPSAGARRYLPVLNHRLRSLLLWLPIAGALSVALGTVYILDQQNLRQGANDPQIQLAEDAAVRLNAGATPHQVVPAGQPPVDVARSLAAFLIVYDGNDRPLAGSGQLDGAMPVPPQGVTASAREAEDRVTWQPRDGVRIAAVVVAYNGGAVLAGRSLRLVDERAGDALLTTAAVWLAGMVGTLVLVVGPGLVLERWGGRGYPPA